MRKGDEARLAAALKENLRRRKARDRGLDSPGQQGPAGLPAAAGADDGDSGTVEPEAPLT